MVPSLYRGRRNKPSYIHATAEFVAELRSLPLEEITEIIYANSRRLFGIPE
jgi:TatD DNase family protein